MLNQLNNNRINTNFAFHRQNLFDLTGEAHADHVGLVRTMEKVNTVAQHMRETCFSAQQMMQTLSVHHSIAYEKVVISLDYKKVN